MQKFHFKNGIDKKIYIEVFFFTIIVSSIENASYMFFTYAYIYIYLTMVKKKWKKTHHNEMTPNEPLSPIRVLTRLSPESSMQRVILFPKLGLAFRAPLDCVYIFDYICM